MRGKRWVLTPHVVSVDHQTARVNLFKVPGGYAIPITFAGQADLVTVTMKKAPDTVEQITSITVIHPGEAKTSTLKWQTAGDQVRLAVPMRRGCAMVSIACSAEADSSKRGTTA
jgi:hypothetical protein